MMTGERLGVGHEPRHGTAYVASWIKALENNPKEIRAAAVDAQRISDWLMARERERSMGDEKAESDQPDTSAGQTREDRDPERPPSVIPAARDISQPEHDAALRDIGRSGQAINPAVVGDRQRDAGPSR